MQLERLQAFLEAGSSPAAFPCRIAQHILSRLLHHAEEVVDSGSRIRSTDAYDQRTPTPILRCTPELKVVC